MRCELTRVAPLPTHGRGLGLTQPGSHTCFLAGPGFKFAITLCPGEGEGKEAHGLAVKRPEKGLVFHTGLPGLSVQALAPISSFLQMYVPQLQVFLPPTWEPKVECMLALPSI